MIELKLERMRHGLTQEDMGRVIGLGGQSYGDKERGATPFSDDEKLKIAEVLKMDYEKFNLCFYDGKLPK